MIGFIMIGIIIIFVIWGYNTLINLRNNSIRSRSGIDVYLQQRFDLIPNLVEVTKGYMQYENEVLEKITELRTSFNKNKDTGSMVELNHRYNNIIANVENYPELKASEQFLKLQKSLIKVESELQAARRIYNNDVTRYNTKINIFPYNIIASMFSFKEMELFVLEGEDKVDVKF